MDKRTAKSLNISNVASLANCVRPATLKSSTFCLYLNHSSYHISKHCGLLLWRKLRLITIIFTIGAEVALGQEATKPRICEMAIDTLTNRAFYKSVDIQPAVI